ncbi:uncharacterized protein MELLADRAFT_38800 [Melampsora larici-populina 98AG31]|uniref:J domain-containing protein n=1 Tax=Melampsora larici-populina (strain 98AG31 / pathotype 3-4-7) TaxID=747676 RepID=F4RZQ3_MELLP|nr:uncharacterized protein MELLADRAFT_38800 [Melampsora larici-populina 98AG31]EGG02146.1 hypothetical protein MELLADRAFT_38800 [Melampsora larici-populina 98AG31]
MSELPFDSEDLNLYEILNLEKSATQSEIRTSYKKLALRYHPDKLSPKATDIEKSKSNETFQKIGLAYQILNDSNKRTLYDSSGQINLNSLDDQVNWNDYFKELWKGEVNSKSIEEFTKSYQGSEEEIHDIKEHYRTFEGDFEQILNNTLCSSQSDEKRIIKLIDNLINSQELPKLKQWTKTKTDKKSAQKRKTLAERESKEAELLSKELGLNSKLLGGQDSSEDTLKALILSNSKNRHEQMIQKLESKAKQDDIESQSKRKKSKRKEIIEEEEENQDEIKLPDEDEFLKLQAEILARKNTKKSSDQTTSSTSKKTSNPRKKPKTSKS